MSLSNIVHLRPTELIGGVDAAALGGTDGGPVARAIEEGLALRRELGGDRTRSRLEAVLNTDLVETARSVFGELSTKVDDLQASLRRLESAEAPKLPIPGPPPREEWCLTPQPLDRIIGAIRTVPAGATTANLLAASQWSAARSVRARPRSGGGDLFGYLHDPARNAAFWLGRIDVLGIPCPRASLLRRVQSLAPAASRVIVVAADREVQHDAYADLGGGRFSCSIVFSRRQLGEMIPIARPEVVVVHLSPSCPEAFDSIALLRSRPETFDLPILLLVDDPGLPSDDRFTARGFDALVRQGGARVEGFERRLAGVLRSSMPPFPTGTCRNVAAQASAA